MLRVDNISKTFNPGTVNEKTALDRLSLHLAPGDFAAVIGSNGAGKSTLLNAVAGSFTVDSGSITLGGRDVTFVPNHRRSRVIGRLFQDPLRGTAPSLTIEENLALAYLRSSEGTAPLSRIRRKDKEFFAQRLELLGMGLEDRMRQPVGLLSGGQRQRLTIARALVRRPQILILDDSASALDFATDAKLRRSLRELDYDPTVFIVSQRTSSVQSADSILVLDDGVLAGQGTHDELLKTCSVYQEIYASQFRSSEGDREKGDSTL